MGVFERVVQSFFESQEDVMPQFSGELEGRKLRGHLDLAHNRGFLKILLGMLLEVAGQRRELPNDYVWIFAGGTTPNAFLEKIGVRMGVRDLTEEAGREGRLAEATA